MSACHHYRDGCHVNATAAHTSFPPPSCKAKGWPERTEPHCKGRGWASPPGPCLPLCPCSQARDLCPGRCVPGPSQGQLARLVLSLPLLVSPHPRHPPGPQGRPQLRKGDVGLVFTSSYAELEACWGSKPFSVTSQAGCPRNFQKADETPGKAPFGPKQGGEEFGTACPWEALPRLQAGGGTKGPAPLLSLQPPTLHLCPETPGRLCMGSRLGVEQGQWSVRRFLCPGCQNICTGEKRLARPHRQRLLCARLGREGLCQAGGRVSAGPCAPRGAQGWCRSRPAGR